MDCLICLEPIDETLEISDHIQFCCKQNYHFDCIKQWIDVKRTCPICKELISQKTLDMFRNAKNNFTQLKFKEKQAMHIIETLFLDIQNIKDRTRNNLDKINRIKNYTQAEIPLFMSRTIPNVINPLNYSRLLHRRGAILSPLIVSDVCIYPSYCRCGNCISEPIGPRWL